MTNCPIFQKACEIAGVNPEEYAVTRKAERVLIRQVSHYIRMVIREEGVAAIGRCYGIHHTTPYNSVMRIEEILYLNMPDRKTAIVKMIVEHFKTAGNEQN